MMSEPRWDVRSEGRAWGKDEAWERFELAPEKFEMVDASSFGPTRIAKTCLACCWSSSGPIRPSGSETRKYGARRSPSYRGEATRPAVFPPAYSQAPCAAI